MSIVGNLDLIRGKNGHALVGELWVLEIIAQTSMKVCNTEKKPKHQIKQTATKNFLEQKSYLSAHIVMSVVSTLNLIREAFEITVQTSI